MTRRLFASRAVRWHLIRLPIAAVALFLAVPVVATTKKQFDAGGREEQRLIEVLRDGRVQDLEPERLEKAIQRLGETKSVAAIDSLVQLLTFRSPTQKDTFDHDTTPLDRYPAAGALYNIGKPALPALVKVIETSEGNSLRSENALFALLNVFNDNRVDGLLYLQQAAEMATSAQAAQRLLHASESAKKYVH